MTSSRAPRFVLDARASALTVAALILALSQAGCHEEATAEMTDADKQKIFQRDATPPPQAIEMSRKMTAQHGPPPSADATPVVTKPP